MLLLLLILVAELVAGITIAVYSDQVSSFCLNIACIARWCSIPPSLAVFIDHVGLLTLITPPFFLPPL